VKLRLLLTSALFVFVQIPTMHAQETADVAKITCEQLRLEKLARSSHEVIVWVFGYYDGKRNNTIIDLQRSMKDEENVRDYCRQHREATVMDAVKNVLSFDK
jgi:hypothetical protein